MTMKCSIKILSTRRIASGTDVWEGRGGMLNSDIVTLHQKGGMGWGWGGAGHGGRGAQRNEAVRISANKICQHITIQEQYTTFVTCKTVNSCMTVMI